MAHDLLKQFSDELKQIRESKQVTIEHIASKTRIDIKFLKAIEEGNFNVIDQIYIRAFIKEYSQTLDLNPDEYINKYDMAKSGNVFQAKPSENEVEVEEKKEEQIIGEEAIHREFDSNSVPPYSANQTQSKTKSALTEVQKKQLIIAGGGASLVIIIVLLLFSIFDSSPNEIITEPNYEEVLEESKTRYEESSGKKSVDLVVQDSLTLNVSANDTAWVMVTKDDILTEDYTMYPGVKKEFRAHSKFNLTVGNSGGITISLNGKPLNFQGRLGQVRYFVIDENGLRVVTNKPAGSDE
ncbi:MAG: DUF4115 domain-containing protein [Bacteroidetes bacterium]|nr:DUF4115 domain-containing protein [Bacteroidota bacterium]